MRLTRGLLSRYKLLLIILGLYFVFGLLLLGSFKLQLNPDGVSYLSIATKYAHGDFGNAVNGYWGPLLSWLLAPFAYLDLNLQTANKLIAVLAGGATTVFIWLIAQKLKIKPTLRLVLAGTVAVLNLYWALTGPITPDGLVLLISAIYIYLLTFKWSTAQSVLLGVVGAAGYYAKAFFLPFFLAHLGAVAFIFYRTENSKNRSACLKNLGLAAAVALVLILPWAVVLSAKYDKLTISTSGSYNLAIMNPSQPGHPMHDSGLLPPPNGSAASSWEDPTYLPVKNWKIWESKTAFKGAVRTFFDNVKRTGAAWLSFSIFSMSFMAILAGWLINRGFKKSDSTVWILFSGILVYCGGYLLVLTEERYLWPVFVWSLILACLWLKEAKLNLSKRAVVFSTFVVLFSLLTTPVTQLYYKRGQGLSYISQSEALKPYIKPGTKIASDTFSSIHHCYYLKAQCYGELKPALGIEENRSQLQKYGIAAAVFLKTTQVTLEFNFLENYQEVSLPDPTVKLFVLKT